MWGNDYCFTSAALRVIALFHVLLYNNKTINIRGPIAFVRDPQLLFAYILVLHLMV